MKIISDEEINHILTTGNFDAENPFMLSHRAVAQAQLDANLKDLQASFESYSKGEISLERLAELIGINFYTLHSAFLKFEPSFLKYVQAERERIVEEIEKAGFFIADSPVEGKPYQYLGCYILRWGKDSEPSIGFNRLESGSPEWQSLKERILKGV